MMAVRTAFQLFCDCWHLYRKYILKTANEEVLEGLKNEADKIFKKYDEKPLEKELLMAVLNEIERKEKA